MLRTRQARRTPRKLPIQGSLMIVPGKGPENPALIVIGEAPGKVEARRGEPFVGPTGKVQEPMLARYFGLRRNRIHFDNLKQEYVEGNPDPDHDEVIRTWGPDLIRRLWKFPTATPVLSVGAFATRFLLDGASLESIHGIPQWSEKAKRIILPVYHPAGLLHSGTDARSSIIRWDYQSAGKAFKMGEEPPIDPYDEPEYTEEYDADLLEAMFLEDVLALDTESDRGGGAWSFQLSAWEGHSLVFCQDRPHWNRVLQMFRNWTRRKNHTLVVHNAPYDLPVMARLGVHCHDLDAKVEIFDTMMAAYLLRYEPQSLKNGARRRLGMEMQEYMEVIGDRARKRQLSFLEDAYLIDWPEYEGRVIHENDGSARWYTPQPLNRRLATIIADGYDGADIEARYAKLDPVHQAWIKDKFGYGLPTAYLCDIPRADAIFYAGRDSDAALRLYPIYKEMIEEGGQADLMKMKMAMMPAGIDMRETGFTADKPHFETLEEDMGLNMDEIREGIVEDFCQSGQFLKDGEYRFNPLSQIQVNLVMRRQGIHTKKTKSGRMTTNKKYMEPLRTKYPFVNKMSDWREHQKVKDSFAIPILRLFPDGADRLRIKCDIKMTRVESGRLSASDPNLMAIPVRTSLGLRVREGFVAQDGWVLGDWDLDQIEMREMADQCQDPHLCGIFRGEIRNPRGGEIDIHTDTASRCFDIDYFKVDKMLHRYPAKRAGFGVITGIQEQGLLDQLLMAGCVRADGSEWTKKAVGILRKEWFNVFTAVEPYLRQCKAECRDNDGVIYSKGGMPRYLPNIFSDDKFKRWEAERQTHSHKIQAAAQEGLQKAMGWLYKKIKKEFGDKVRWILQIHDELIMECKDEANLKAELDDVMVEGLTQHGAQLSVPVKSKGGWGYRWSELEH